VYHCVYNACNSKDASYDCTDVNQELNEGLFILREHDCDRRELIVEHKEVLSSTEVGLVVGCQLVYIVLSVISVSEVRRHCYQIKVSLDILSSLFSLGDLSIHLHSIKWVENA